MEIDRACALELGNPQQYILNLSLGQGSVPRLTLQRRSPEETIS